jgi:predicted nucleic acid-binding protein
LTDAFDADVLIYAASMSRPSHRALRKAITRPSTNGPAGVGSTLLLTETLIKPIRHGHEVEARDLNELLAHLELYPFDEETADLSVDLGANYGLRPFDVAHLATAVWAGADRFITNNRRDFPTAITEIDVTYPEHL